MNNHFIRNLNSRYVLDWDYYNILMISSNIKDVQPILTYITSCDI